MNPLSLLWLTATTAFGSLSTVYVDMNAPGPVHDGATWQTAFTTVQQGINAAETGDEVWVADGVYGEAITLADGVALYGGFAGTETLRSQRDWSSYPAVLDGSGLGSAVVTMADSSSPFNRIDGFTIRDGLPTIGEDDDGEPVASTGGGITCEHSMLTVSNNVITGNAAMLGGGIFSADSTITVLNNSIVDNRGQDLWSGLPAQNGWGAGICCADDGAALIANNVIADNQAYDGSAAAGVVLTRDCLPTPMALTNNTITGNVTSDTFTLNIPVGVITNNVVAYNAGVGIGVGGASVVCNDSFGNNFNYSSRNRVIHDTLTPPSTNLSVNPLFADYQNDDLHLQQQSPLIDAGSNAAVQSGWLDMDGQARVQGSTVDIGADEVAQ